MKAQGHFGIWEWASVSTVLDDFSMEMTGKDVAKVEAAASVIPAGTRVNVTFLDNEDLAMRVGAAAAVKRLGFIPVPHISSRRIKSREMLEEYLEALRDVGAAENVLVIGGDPTVAMGPYEESLAVIESGALQQYGVRHISTGGHPSGDPNISRYLTCTKSFEQRRPRTVYRLTALGKNALNRYLDHVEAVIKATRHT